MGNRIIKESICSSPTIDKLSWLEEVTFYRLIVNCDDFGLMDGRLPILKAKLFPLKEDITNENLDDLINKLAAAGLVTRYKNAEGEPYLLLPTWLKHQTIRNKKSKYPMPSNYDVLVSDKEEKPKKHNNHTVDSNGNQLKSIEINCCSNPIQSNSLKEIKEKDNKNPLSLSLNEKEAVNLWEKNLGLISPVLCDKICDLLKDCGLPAFKEAVDRAVEYNRKSFAWVRAVTINIANGDEINGSRSNGKKETGNRNHADNTPDNKQTTEAGKACGQVI